MLSRPDHLAALSYSYFRCKLSLFCCLGMLFQLLTTVVLKKFSPDFLAVLSQFQVERVFLGLGPYHTVRHSAQSLIDEADDAGIGIPASSISFRYRSISVPDWGTLIPVPDSPAFRHLTKLHKDTRCS
jgi:hypothetical protein